ncbi:MAG: sulfatase [Chloroflexi bacterium]|nr:MAG: sulfatase [Chloroflexota bacterium]
MRILYIDLDTLRPDHLGCYGYHRSTSPHIDRIAEQGVRFEQYYCSDAPCLPSRAALMTGTFGYHNGVVGHGGTAADLRLEGAGREFRTNLGNTSLPGLLKGAGLYTVYIGAFAERHSAWFYYSGFREIHDTGKYGQESAEEVTPAVLDWIDRNAQKDNWYLHINYWDPHTPYRAPESFGDPFFDDPPPGWLTPEVLARHRQLAGPHSAQDLNMYDNRPDPRYPRSTSELCNMEDVRSLFDGYDCGIAYVDEHVGQVMDALGAKGVLDDLVVIISSDHGENMGELGIYAEHGTADSITCRIPMIVRWPGGPVGHVDDGLHYHFDLLPTLAELLGQPPAAHWDGQSFSTVLREGEECGREYLVISQCAHVAQRSVRWGQWLYMRTYHDGYHLFPDEMLYNVELDPHLQWDLALHQPDVCLQGRNYLGSWVDKMQATMPVGYTVDPMQTVLAEGGPYHARGNLRRYLQRLRESGRAEQAERLAQLHPDEL